MLLHKSLGRFRSDREKTRKAEISKDFSAFFASNFFRISIDPFSIFLRHEGFELPKELKYLQFYDIIGMKERRRYFERQNKILYILWFGKLYFIGILAHDGSCRIFIFGIYRRSGRNSRKCACFNDYFLVIYCCICDCRLYIPSVVSATVLFLPLCYECIQHIIS